MGPQSERKPSAPLYTVSSGYFWHSVLNAPVGPVSKGSVIIAAPPLKSRISVQRIVARRQECVPYVEDPASRADLARTPGLNGASGAGIATPVERLEWEKCNAARNKKSRLTDG